MEHTIEYKGHKAHYSDEQKEQAKALGLDLETELISAMKYEHSLAEMMLNKVYSSSEKSYIALSTIYIARFKESYGIDLTILFKRLLDDNEEQSKEFGCFSYEMSCHDGIFEIMLCR